MMKLLLLGLRIDSVEIIFQRLKKERKEAKVKERLVLVEEIIFPFDEMRLYFFTDSKQFRKRISSD